jgi:hypothetical protein
MSFYKNKISTFDTVPKNAREHLRKEEGYKVVFFCVSIEYHLFYLYQGP